MFRERAAATNTVQPPSEGLTLEKILNAKRLLEENRLPPEQTPDHYAARQATLDHLASQMLMVKDESVAGKGNLFCGVRIVIDERVPPGCIEVRARDGSPLAICGGIA